MHDDEQLAEKLDEQRYAAELAARRAEVDDVIAGGTRPRHRLRADPPLTGRRPG
jgi:hypothetical protein